MGPNSQHPCAGRRGGDGHCSSAERYFQSLQRESMRRGERGEGGGLGGGLGGHHPGPHPDQDPSAGSETDSIESIYKKLSTPKVSLATQPVVKLSIHNVRVLR